MDTDHWNRHLCRSRSYLLSRPNLHRHPWLEEANQSYPGLVSGLIDMDSWKCSQSTVVTHIIPVTRRRLVISFEVDVIYVFIIRRCMTRSSTVTL
jgi:hypothetical protein